MQASFARRHLITVSLLFLSAFDRGMAQRPSAVEPPTYVSSNAAPGAFPLSSAGKSAPLWVSTRDFPGVLRAANDLRTDIGRVTGAAPLLSSDTNPSQRDVVIIGTIGRSPLVDGLVRQRKLDVSSVAGRWETFLIQTVANPAPGIARGLVIAGSDKRGTIFGIYDLSARIGVSPWTWWADVPVRRESELFVLPGWYSLGPPAVKYRGIFINDEAPAFSGWAREKFGGINHQVYERVFELILRLKGNYLWPAMWGNAFADDDSLNARLADDYGIVMGTSHHEPLTRAQQEWRRYGKGPWNYEENDSTLRAFWRAGIQRMGTRENVVTIGMRGDGDMPMTQGSNIALLERIVADQRAIIADVTGKDASATPQLWALYKEVQDYYDKGMRVPDDVTLLFADDNWGNIRRLPAPQDRNRKGGFGVYYHFDYVGGPRNYKWLNTNPLARVWEQMHVAYESGADRIWIVNVGDLKPMELPIQFFLEYAWRPEWWPAERLPEYTRRWVERQFGAEHAGEIAEVVTTYLKFAGRRKPELLTPETYSLANYREAETIVAGFSELATRAERIQRALPDEFRDAYYELVLHPVLASANLNDLHVTVAKNRLYAQQGRASTNALADRARRLFARDAEISRYYNDTLAGGKWPHMMDQTHIGYTYWQEPPRNVMPRVDVIQVPPAAELGVAWEGQQPFDPAMLAGGGGGPFRNREAALPEFDAYQRQSYWIDVFNRGQAPFEFTAHAGQPWVVVTPDRGKVELEQRLAVTVDWTKAPVGLDRVPITVTGPNERRVVIQAVVRNPAAPKRDEIIGFVEGNGYVSIEAEHFTRAVAAAPISWQRIPDLGRTLSGMTALPVTAPSQRPAGGSPRLEYRMFLHDSGTVQLRAYLSPTLNYSGRKEGLRYAVSFDNESPQVVNMAADTALRSWEQSVADNVTTPLTRHHLDRAGEHVLNFWMVDPGVVLQRLVVDLGGVKPSYLGPPESFYRPAKPGAAATPASQLKGAPAP
jgi:Glycosyl hydrolase family 115/Gylcosyl hydrolase family 115 C-terminal domain